MPIFDKELIDNVSNRETPSPKIALGSPITTEIKIPGLGGFENYGVKKSGDTGLSLEDIQKLTNVPNSTSWDGPIEMIPRSELLANKRYGLYERGVDLENIYGLKQGPFSQLANGIVKMAGTAIGTFAQSFATLPNTISALKSGNLKDLVGNPNGYEGSIDTWMNNMDDAFPNYVTRHEKEHPFLAAIPGFAGSANFWGNSVIKNLGFTAGAIAGAVVQDAAVGLLTEGIGEIPLLAAQIGKASLWLNKIFTGTNDLEKVLEIGKGALTTSEELLTLKQLAHAAAYTKLTNGAKYGIALFGSARTESGIEGRDGYRQVKEDLLKHYKLEHLGTEPTEDDLKEIENYATNAMNTRFAINMAILTVSDAIQFDNLFKSFTYAKGTGKGLASSFVKEAESFGKIGLKEGSLDEFEKKVTKGIPSKVWDFIKPKIPNIFSEGIYEEGGQYAAERGTYDYYTRKYKDPKRKENVNNWDSLNEVIKSTQYGLQEQFGSIAGIENMFVGGLSALVSGGLLGKIDKIKGHGKDARLQMTINSLNQYGLTGILNDKYSNTLNSIGIAKEMAEAAQSGNIYKYKNLKDDMFFNFVMSRIPSGMHDVTIEQLNMLKDLPKEEFEKTFGMDFNTSSKKTVDTYVDTLIDEANNIKKSVDVIDNTFKNPFKNTVNPKTEDEAIATFNYNTFNSWKIDLARYTAVTPDTNSRLESIQSDVSKIHSTIDNNLLGGLTDKTSLKEYSKIYEEQANQLSQTITEHTTPEDKKRIKNQIKTLRTLSEKINLSESNGKEDLNLFENLLNFELNNRQSDKEKTVPIEHLSDLYTYGVDINRLNNLKQRANNIYSNLISESGFNNYFKQAEEMASEKEPEIKTTTEVPTEVPTEEPVVKHEFKNINGEIVPVEIGREYELPKTKLARIDKIADDRWQVTAPNGDITFYSTEEKAKAVFNDVNSDVADLAKVKVISLNPDGTVKVEDLAGNIQNIDPSKLEGYAGIQTQAEKIAKNKEDIQKQQAEIINNSGNIGTNNPANDVIVSEGKLLDAKILFISGISESEDPKEQVDDSGNVKDVKETAIHIRNSREFLNNVGGFKNRTNIRAILVTPLTEEAYGLKGLTQMSYGVKDEELKTKEQKEEFLKKTTNLKNGFIAQVFVEQVGDRLFFVDKNGNQIGEVGKQVENINNVIFQTMRTTNLFYLDGKTPIYRKDQKEEAEAYSAAWTKQRADIFATEPSTSPIVYGFQVSRGIAIKGDAPNYIAGTLISKENETKILANNQTLIQIPTVGIIAHHTGQINMPNGRPILVYQDNVEFLNNIKFKGKRALAIYEAINQIATEITEQSNNNKKVIINKKLARFLQNVLYWRNGKTEIGTNHINISEDGTSISFAGKNYSIPEIGSKKDELLDDIEKAFHNVNNKTLSAEMFSKPFTEYYMKDGILVSNEWTNYQTYLLSSKYPDGSARSIEDTPLSTKIKQPTDAVPYTHKQKYATLVGLELPVGVINKPENKVQPTPKTEKKNRKYDYDGEADNIFTTPFGDVIFTIKEGEDPKFDENDDTFIATRNKIIKKLNDNRIKKGEKVLPEEDLIPQANGVIEAFVKKELEADVVVAPEAPIVVPVTPVSDVEAKKADIERRRQEDLYNSIKGQLKPYIDAIEYVKKEGGDVAKAQAEMDSVVEELKRTSLTKDTINAKYDAELAALEGVKPAEAPKEPGSFDVKNVKKRGNMGFRKVGAMDRKDRMTEADIKAFKEWHAKNVSFIPFGILENMINLHNGEKAWGVFENGVAKFVRGGLRGTEYHEVGEAIWNGMLSPEEQVAILADERNRIGQFTDRETGKKYNYDDPTVSDQMLKERVLDDFSDFRLGNLPARSLGEAILKFFRRILEFIKSFVSNPSLKEELFKAIESGKFNDRELSSESKSMPPQYRAAGNLTEEQTNDYVKDMTAISAAIILGNGNIGTIDKSAIYNLRSLTSNDVFNKIEELYTERGVRQELGDIAWKDLVIKTKQELKTLLKVDFNEEDLVNINEGETNKNDYAREPFSTDWKKSAPVGIKFVSATLPITESTNQENSTSFELPKLKVKKQTQTYSLLPYTRAFSTILDTLKNTTGIGKVISKLVALANQDSNYVRMFQRVGGNLKNKTVNFKDFKFEDWRLFIEMMQTYTKQKPNAIVQYISQGQVYSGSAMVTGIVNITTRGWIQNLRDLANDPDSVITWNNVDKTYSITDLSGIPIDTPQQKVSFLSELGISFPLEAFNKLKEEQQKKFTLVVNSLKKYLQDAKEIMSVQKRTLDVAGQYDALATMLVSVTHPNQETTRVNLEGKQSNSFSDNNSPSIFENDFNEASSIDELLIIRPELKDVYSKGSWILRKGGQFFDKEGNRTSLQLKVGYIEGTKNKDDNRGITSVKLNLGDRFTQEINQNLLGQYYIMIPADGSTEWMMNMGNHISFEDIEQGKDGWKKINEIFRGYLTDDVALALDADNRIQAENVGGLRKIAETESKLETLKSVTNKSDDQKEEVKKLTAQLEYLKKKPYELRFFKDILSDKILAEVDRMISIGSTQTDIEKFIDDNIEDINNSIKEYIDGKIDKTIDILTQNGQIQFINQDKTTEINYFKYTKLDDTFTKKEGLKKNKLTSEDVRNIITFANVNYEINNIEFHKIIFGDPLQFAIKEDGTLDATKRFKSFFSPRRTTFDSPEFNTFLNEDMNNAGDIQLLPGEPGYHENKAWIDTVTVADVTIVGSIANMKNVSPEIKKAFAKTNEGDASSIMMDGTYRELKMKNAQWTDKAEDWHQWQMAYTRQNLPGFKYSEDSRGKALEAHDKSLLKTKEPKHVIEIIKPIVSGVTNGANRINLVLDKFSQMPLYYSMVKGTNLENLYLKMLHENKGYIIMISGRKLGAEALHDLYLKDGSFNDAVFNNNIEVPWKAYGIQVENSYENSEKTTRGSQITKLSTLDLYENGEPIGDTSERKEVIAKEVNRNRDLLNRLHKNGYERFLYRLGITDLGGSYKIIDKRALAKTLQDEMFRTELSDNVKDSIQLDKNGEFIIPFEASPAYLQIKSILYSFVDKEITSPKVHGNSYVQAPVTLWESSKDGRKIAVKTKDGYRQITIEEFKTYSLEEQKKVVLTDDTLKFYEDEDGKRYCEVMLPHWFKSKLGKHANKSDEELIKFLNSTSEGSEGKELLSGIGFRIPTQSMSSIEAFTVKGFLPQYMGKTVIVPSEITTKAGSDFDIDKLSMYLKSIYNDKHGDIKIIRLKETEEATKAFYSNVFDENLEKQKINKAELFDAATIVVEGLDDPQNLGNRYSNLIDILFEDTNTLEERRDVLDDIMEKLEKLGDKETQSFLKDKFIRTTYRRALENEYYDSLEKLITLPENFQRLISPVGDDGLKEIANELDSLRGYDETKIKNRILDRNYMTSLRHAFVSAKKWIGIAAVNITGHSLTQKFKAYIDPERFNNQPLADRKILKYGNGEILLDHNKLEKDGKSYISLSGRLDADGKFISDGLSGFATTFVDVAKDPYVLKIIKSELAVGTFFFLRRIGVPKRQLAMFMNQPIIEEYLTMLDNKGSKTLFDSRYITAIQNKFPSIVTQQDLDGFNKSELSDNIKNYYATKDLGDYKNHEQNNILQEFLKYAKMAEHSFSFSQASNYDTTKFQSGDSLQLKQWRTEAAQKKNIISSVGELLENTFIGQQAEYLDSSMDDIGKALVLESPKFTDITNEVLKSFEQDRFLSKDKFDRIANKIKAAFLDYIIQKRSDVAVNLQQQLVSEKDSVAQMLVKAKKDFPGVQILEDLEVDSSGRVGGAQTIKLKVNDKLAYTENMYKGMMRELRDDPRTNALYKGIVRLAIIQGTYQSPISIKNIIPVEDYAKHITPILAGLEVDDDIRAFAKSNEFQRNEWQDNEVVPIVEPTLRQNPQTQAEEDLGLPRTFQGLFKMVGRGLKKRKVPGFFPTIEKLGVNTKDRQLLFINSKYQGKASNYDVIKIPRAIPINKEDVTEGKIDLVGGKEITARDYAIRTEKGDLSLKNFYGYQKVKYADGSPLIAYYDQEGNPVYVYKFINLHGDGQYATEYYGDGRPSIFNNGSEKNVKNIEGTIVSNEIADQAIIDFYGGESVPQDLADPIIATIERESENLASTQPSTNVKPTIDTSREWSGDLKTRRENYNLPAKTVSPEVKIDKDIQDIINKSNLDAGEYEVIEINGKQRVIDKRFVPERVKKGFSKFYSSRGDDMFVERYGKKVIIPGFEDINLMMEQNTNDVYELSTGFSIPSRTTTQKEIKDDIKNLFEGRDVRKITANSKKTDINDSLLTKITPEGLPPIDNTNQNNCG